MLRLARVGVLCIASQAPVGEQRLLADAEFIHRRPLPPSRPYSLVRCLAIVAGSFSFSSLMRRTQLGFSSALAVGAELECTHRGSVELLAAGTTVRRVDDQSCVALVSSLCQLPLNVE